MTAKEILINDHNAKALKECDTIDLLGRVMTHYAMGLITVKEFNKQLSDLSKQLNKAIIK